MYCSCNLGAQAASLDARCVKQHKMTHHRIAGDQGWFKSQEEVNACRWVFDADLAEKSFTYVAEQAPVADAYLALGMCNFRTGPNGQPQRMLHQTTKLESILGKPVVSHDTALYWRIFKTLSIKPTENYGRLLGSL